MNEPVRITCGICEDLIPLVEDGIAHGDSREVVYSHIAVCAECREKYPELSGKEADIPKEEEKDDRRILRNIREKVSGWVLLGISISLLAGILIVLTSSSSPWLMILVFPFICGIVYLIGGRVWKYVPYIAAGFWILVTLLMDVGKTVNWRTAVADSVISAVFPLIFSYIGALAAALFKYAFKGEF